MNRVRINQQAAGYMELNGAKKDGECTVVEVLDGISKEKGCCSNFWPPTAKNFSCGECDYVTDSDQGEQADAGKPLGKDEARKMSFKDILDSERPAFGGIEKE